MTQTLPHPPRRTPLDHDPIEKLRIESETLIRVCLGQFGVALPILIAGAITIIRDLMAKTPNDADLRMLHRRLVECWQRAEKWEKKKP